MLWQPTFKWWHAVHSILKQCAQDHSNVICSTIVVRTCHVSCSASLFVQHYVETTSPQQSLSRQSCTLAHGHNCSCASHHFTRAPLKPAALPCRPKWTRGILRAVCRTRDRCQFNDRNVEVPATTLCRCASAEWRRANKGGAGQALGAATRTVAGCPASLANCRACPYTPRVLQRGSSRGHQITPASVPHSLHGAHLPHSRRAVAGTRQQQARRYSTMQRQVARLQQGAADDAWPAGHSLRHSPCVEDDRASS